MKGWLVVFAREPVPGRAKTRLSPPFSPAEAAAFYRCLLADVLDESAAAAARLALEPVLVVDPPGATAELAARAPAGFRALPQAPGELGVRMAAAAHQAAAAGAPCALLRGSDSPCLDRGSLREAALALREFDLVVRPDRDGGYNLVGLGPAALAAAASGALFDHPMSTPTVLDDTLRRAGSLRLRSHEMAPGFDVDRFDDLRWLAAERHKDGTIPCPRSLAFLDERRLWPSLGAAPDPLREGPS
jgi:hypothetical protein